MIKYYAVIGLLRMGESAPMSDIEAVARHAETRGDLFDRLNELGKLALFPQKFKTQTSLAEAMMVTWLIYPTELRSAPDEIELIEIAPDDEEPDKEVYFFRFRTFEPHWAADKGWMLGWAGPFPKNGPLETFGCWTFSEFRPPDEQDDDDEQEDDKDEIDDDEADDDQKLH